VLAQTGVEQSAARGFGIGAGEEWRSQKNPGAWQSERAECEFQK